MAFRPDLVGGIVICGGSVICGWSAHPRRRRPRRLPCAARPALHHGRRQGHVVGVRQVGHDPGLSRGIEDVRQLRARGGARWRQRRPPCRGSDGPSALQCGSRGGTLQDEPPRVDAARSGGSDRRGGRHASSPMRRQVPRMMRKRVLDECVALVRRRRHVRRPLLLPLRTRTATEVRRRGQRHGMERQMGPALAVHCRARQGAWVGWPQRFAWRAVTVGLPVSSLAQH